MNVTLLSQSATEKSPEDLYFLLQYKSFYLTTYQFQNNIYINNEKGFLSQKKSFITKIEFSSQKKMTFITKK
jgi:hypothetical protein